MTMRIPAGYEVRGRASWAADMCLVRPDLFAAYVRDIDAAGDVETAAEVGERWRHWWVTRSGRPATPTAAPRRAAP